MLFSKQQTKVKGFMRIGGQFLGVKDEMPPSQETDLIISLLVEELAEYNTSTNKANKVKEACDIAYCLYGALIRYGLRAKEIIYYEPKNQTQDIIDSLKANRVLSVQMVVNTLAYLRDEIDSEFGQGTFEECFNLVDQENMRKVALIIEKDENGKIMKTSLPKDCIRAEREIGDLLIQKMKDNKTIGVSCNGSLIKY